MFPGQTAYIHTCTLNKLDLLLIYLKLLNCCRTPLLGDQTNSDN